MADVVDPATRSRMMGAIGRRNTSPEIVVRKHLHAAGFRYRLDVASLPGRPDLVLSRWRVALFVHGCFWHRHPGCARAVTPASNTVFWDAKLSRNVQRDAEAVERLRGMGWRVGIVWECAVGGICRADALRGCCEWIRGGEPWFTSDEICPPKGSGGRNDPPRDAAN